MIGLGLGITRQRQRSSDWSPANIPGLAPSLAIATQRAMGLLWQDAGKTTPAVADGDPIRVATCPWTGEDYVAPSDAARPLLWSEGGGLWSAAFDGVDDALRCGVANAPQPFTLAVRAKLLTAANVFQLLAAEDGNTGALGWNPSGEIFLYGYTGIVAAVVRDTDWHNYLGRASGGTAQAIRYDGVAIGSGGACDANFNEINAAYNGASAYSNLRISHLIVASTEIDDATAALLEAWMSA